MANDFDIKGTFRISGVSGIWKEHEGPGGKNQKKKKKKSDKKGKDDPPRAGKGRGKVDIKV